MMNKCSKTRLQVSVLRTSGSLVKRLFRGQKLSVAKMASKGVLKLIAVLMTLALCRKFHIFL